LSGGACAHRRSHRRLCSNIAAPSSYAGISANADANWNDGTGCACNWGFRFDAEDVVCIKVPVPQPPLCCETKGSETNCTAIDAEAFCGTRPSPLSTTHTYDGPQIANGMRHAGKSDDEAANFKDGSCCSCVWGFQFDSATTSCTKKPIPKVPVPRTVPQCNGSPRAALHHLAARSAD
jgi:hypothetical protein